MLNPNKMEIWFRWISEINFGESLFQVNLSAVDFFGGLISSWWKLGPTCFPRGCRKHLRMSMVLSNILHLLILGCYIIQLLTITDIRVRISKPTKKTRNGSKTKFLREPQHTPGAYPRLPQTPKWKEFLHKLLVGGLGYVPGVCWKILRKLQTSSNTAPYGPYDTVKFVLWSAFVPMLFHFLTTLWYFLT